MLFPMPKGILPSGVYHLHILLYVPPKKRMPCQTADIAPSFQIPFFQSRTRIMCSLTRKGRVGKVSAGNELSNFHLLNTGILPCWGPVRFTL